MSLLQKCNLHKWKSEASSAGIYYTPPENNLKVFKWSFLWLCREIRVPCNGDKSQPVKLLCDTKVVPNVFWHCMKFDAHLTHIEEGSTEKQTSLNYPDHNRARPYLHICFHFADHRSAKIYGNQKSPQNKKQHTVEFPLFFGGDFLIAIKKTHSHLLIGKTTS